MSKGKILHITPWYPTADDPGFAIWIKRQIDSLEDYDNEILHLQIVPKGLGIKSQRYGTIKRVLLKIPTSNWRIRELKFFALLCWQLLWKYRTRDYKCINFHIAYPGCVYIHWIRKMIKCPLLITEHWSYYHFHFFSKKKLTRIKKMFSRGIPVITVSKALGNDIAHFAGCDIENHVIPNVVDASTFHNNDESRKPLRFFMVSFWRDHKQPLQVIESIHEARKKHPDIELYIGGYGPLLGKMEVKVRELGLESNCFFLGQLDSNQIAEEMNRSIALIHPTVYETFSVVCAEAQSCGTPVITNPVGALPEYLNESNAILRVEGQSWAAAIDLFLEKTYNNAEIAQNAALRFDKKVIGTMYSKVIEGL